LENATTFDKFYHLSLMSQ